jgi:flagellar P-ring protein precursor FlgI
MRRLALSLLMLLAATGANAQAINEVKLKEIARVAGARDNPLTGFGLVFGLSGSGDSQRNRATLQSVANTLRTYGVNVALDDLASRNVAAVIVTAKLPAFAEPGQPLDVLVSSSGDARSLLGGTLMLAPLSGPDGKVYAIAQGAISVGGYQFEGLTASVQKNHPTVGVIPSGGTVEQAPPLQVVGDGRSLSILLNEPDFTMANRIVESLRAQLGVDARAEHAGKVVVYFPTAAPSLVAAVARIENVSVRPERKARVVVNERTGTIVAGGDVRLGRVSVSQGDLRVEISTEWTASQPENVSLYRNSGVRTALVPNTTITTDDGGSAPVVGVPEGATVADLLQALRRIHLPSRDVIAVLQSIKAAGALDGELVIQ